MATVGSFAVLLSALVCAFAVTSGDDLTPFLAWSNSDVLSSVKSSDSVSDIATALAEKSRKGNVFVLFLAEELSFDDIAKNAAVFGDHDNNDKLNNLKSVMMSAKSQLWTGVKNSYELESWPSYLASKVHTGLTRVDAEDVLSGRSVSTEWSGVVEVNMNGKMSLSDQDTVISTVMEGLKDIPHVAVFTQAQQIQKQVHKRAVNPREVTLTTDTSGPNTKYCPVGGIFKKPASNVTCMLFCVDQLLLTVKLDNETTATCNLTHAASINYCCPSNSTDFGPSCEGTEDPFVKIEYDKFVDHNSSSVDNTTNVCEDYFFGNVSQSLGVKTVTGLSVTVAFVFKKNFNLSEPIKDNYKAAWNYIIDTSIAYINSTGNTTRQLDYAYARKTDNKYLYENFEVPHGLSYACSARNFSEYVPVYANDSRSNSSELSEGTASYSQIVNETMIENGYIQSIIISSIQADVFDVGEHTDSFREAYNCIGYFSDASMMGIFTMVVLVIILYISVICMFGMKSIDKFEDPRGQALTVEKLH